MVPLVGRLALAGRRADRDEQPLARERGERVEASIGMQRTTKPRRAASSSSSAPTSYGMPVCEP